MPLDGPAEALCVTATFNDPVQFPEVDKWKKDFEVMGKILHPKLQW